jgi:hypothetical protein
MVIVFPAAILTVTVAVAGVVPLTVTVAVGPVVPPLVPEVVVEIEQIVVGAQASCTLPVNPPDGVSVTVKLAGVPFVTAKDIVDGVKLKSVVEVAPPPPVETNAVPVPVSETFCGELVPLSVIVNVPVSAVATVGVKVTEIVQLVFAARVAPQVYVALKSPVIWMLLIVSGVAPEFATSIVCAVLTVFSVWGRKFSVPGDTATFGMVFPKITATKASPLLP